LRAKATIGSSARSSTNYNTSSCSGSSETFHASHHSSIESFVDDDNDKETGRATAVSTHSDDDDAAVTTNLMTPPRRETVEWVQPTTTIRNVDSTIVEGEVDPEAMRKFDDRSTSTEHRTLPVATTTLTAVVVDEEQERQHSRLDLPSTVQAEVIYIKQRRIIIGALMVVALVGVGAATTSAVAVVVTTRPTMSPTLARRGGCLGMGDRRQQSHAFWQGPIVPTTTGTRRRFGGGACARLAD
jgi:hypothetical protein